MYLQSRRGCDSLLVSAPSIAVGILDVPEPEDGDVSRIGVALARHLQRLALLRRHVLRPLRDHRAARHHNLATDEGYRFQTCTEIVSAQMPK